MPINLSKGQKVDLTKTNPGLKKVIVGLGWDVNAFDSGADFDLDAAAFMVDAGGKCPTEKDFIFYGNLAHPSESVTHMGDNLTGEGDGDDEQIKIDLSKVPANIEKIAFTVTIYDANSPRPGSVVPCPTAENFHSPLCLYTSPKIIAVIPE